MRLSSIRYLLREGFRSIWQNRFMAIASVGVLVSCLLLTGGCADPFGPKTVRASMGAVFRRPVWSVTPEELGALLRHSGIPLYGAALRPDALDARQADYSRCALAIGSEGRGLSREVLDLCDKTVLIPMSPRCESLNAAIAAAVLLWESWR